MAFAFVLVNDIVQEIYSLLDGSSVLIHLWQILIW